MLWGWAVGSEGCRGLESSCSYKPSLCYGSNPLSDWEMGPLPIAGDLFLAIPQMQIRNAPHFPASTVPRNLGLPSAEAYSPTCLHCGSSYLWPLSWPWGLGVFPLHWHIRWAQHSSPFFHFCCWWSWQVCPPPFAILSRIQTQVSEIRQWQGTHLRPSQWSCGGGSWGEGGSSPSFSSWVMVGGSLYANNKFCKIFLTDSLRILYMLSGEEIFNMILSIWIFVSSIGWFIS